MSLHLDFETFSEKDIKSVGMFRYAEDYTTEALILGWAIGDDRPVAVDLTKPDALDRLDPVFSAISRGIKCCAHNSQFERLIWELVSNFPVTPKASQWECTAARARMLAIPGALDRAARAVGLGYRKDPRGDELIQLFSKPQKSRKRGDTSTFRIYPEDRPEDFKAFMDYCCQDVVVEQALDKILPVLSDVEQKTFELDFKINRRGLPVNMDRVRKAKGFVEEYSAGLVKRAEEISGCRPTQREKTLEFLESKGFEIPNLQAATVEELASQPGLPDDLRELLDMRIELSRAGTKKLTAIENCVSDDDRIRGSFLYSAASTRRWSSTGVQVHNLQKPEGEANPDVAMSLLDDDPFDLCHMFTRPLSVLAQSIRTFFEAQNGVFAVADYSSVEPRGLAWSANEEWLLQAYHNKEDAYKITASRVYGIPVASIAKDSKERFMGKQLVLGCGYGMGPPRFQVTCFKFGQALSDDEAAKAVYGYRDSVPNIVKFWKNVEQACIKALRTGNPVRCGRYVMRPETLANGFLVLFVDMPSGSIAYPAPSIGQEEWNGSIMSTFEFYTPLGSSWIKTDTFGGSLVENIIQALTRDILRDGMLAADAAGFNLVGHVHDEAISEGDYNKNDLREFEHLLCSSSDWAEGFPIEMESYLARTYRK
jgi:DNA polymerase